MISAFVKKRQIIVGKSQWLTRQLDTTSDGLSTGWDFIYRRIDIPSMMLTWTEIRTCAWLPTFGY